MGGICVSGVRSLQVIAHRGASKAEAENTLAAFRRAGAMGADAVELDVRRTRDGVLVVHHDPHLPDGRLDRATSRAPTCPPRADARRGARRLRRACG